MFSYQCEKTISTFNASTKKVFEYKEEFYVYYFNALESIILLVIPTQVFLNGDKSPIYPNF